MTKYQSDTEEIGRPKNQRISENFQWENGHVFDMVVFSHLKWDFAYQRPQHLISGMSESYKILFVEEPTLSNYSLERGVMTYEVSPYITVLQSTGILMTELGDALDEYFGGRRPDIAWFYSASFVPVLTDFEFNTVIYDCMDELTLFKYADQALILQEKRLLLAADVVFTGGKSLYEAKRKLHSNVYCFPSSVDIRHFEKALNGIAVPDDIKNINGTVVGYYGVIDERIDLDLILGTAKENPDIEFVLIGPTTKIEDHDLPYAANIHYLGMKSYSELPAYLKRFDIAMMPFAINDATRFISPTKTLEYMAAGKPVISTRIEYVVTNYSEDIELINDVEEFSDKIQQIIISRNINLSTKYAHILERTSWSNTVNEMKTIINKL